MIVLKRINGIVTMKFECKGCDKEIVIEENDIKNFVVQGYVCNNCGKVAV